MSLLERYVGGAHEAVWNEIVASGADDIRAQPMFSDANAVAAETMRRVRLNLETLKSRLVVLEYKFGVYPDGSKMEYSSGPLVEPQSAMLQSLDQLVAKSGPIPLSLESFWRVVGAVDFIGQHAWWPEGADPIVVESPEVALLYLDDWLDQVAEGGPDDAGPFLAAIAPDDLHKDNVSGGEPYSFLLPNGAADAIVENEWHEIQFVPYLREAILVWGGFPGFARLNIPLRPELRALTSDLVTF